MRVDIEDRPGSEAVKLVHFALTSFFRFAEDVIQLLLDIQRGATFLAALPLLPDFALGVVITSEVLLLCLVPLAVHFVDLSQLRLPELRVRSASDHEVAVLKAISAPPLNVSADHVANLGLSVLDPL